jgi:hypothetical protein
VDSSSPSSPDGHATSAFQDYAEAQATATVRTLLAQAAKPALAELEALRVAIDVRCQSLTATLSSTSNIDPAPVRELVDRLAHAAELEAGAAARAARTLALEEAEARLQSERAESQKQLDAQHAEARKQLDTLRTEAAAARAASQLELRSLTDALETATQQAETVRADRDAQLEALRIAAEQVAAMGAERDAHLRDADAAREHAKTVQGEQDALLEAARISNARHAKLIEQAETRATAAQAQAATAQAQASAAQAQADTAQQLLAAAHAQAEAAQAKFVEAQTQLAAAQGELAAAQAEAEQRLAGGAREIEALRAELERVRVDLDAARDAAAREAAACEAAVAEVRAIEMRVEAVAAPVEHAVVAAVASDQPVEVPAVFATEEHAEHVGHAEPREHVEPIQTAVEPAIALLADRAAGPMPAPEPVQLAVEAPEPPAVHLVEERGAAALARAEAEAHENAVQPERAVTVAPESTPFEEPSGVDPVRAMYQAISGAADLSQVLDALVDGVGSLFPRTALFVVKTRSKRLQGWRSVGFSGPAAITREFEFPLTTDSGLTRAVSAGRTIFTGEGQTQSGEAWTVTFPVTTGGRVVAVVHADGGGRTGEPAQAFNRETALDLGHTLVRMAGERIGALTMSARAAFGNVMSTKPATPPVAAAEPSAAVAQALKPEPLVPAAPAVIAGPVNGAASTAAPAADIRFNTADVNDARVDGTASAPAAPAAAASLEDAGRYASQLVSELSRYNLTATAAAPADQNLQAKLADQIEDARGTAAAQPAPGGSALGLFEEALGKMLGNGPIDASVSVQPV